MDTRTAITALRALDALAPARRQHLATLVATAHRDAERARIVLQAKHENRHTREALEASLKAELAARHERALSNPERLSEAVQTFPARVDRLDGIRVPAPRPVTTTWTTPTKTATTSTKRPEGIGANRAQRVAERPEPKPRVLPEHGTVTRYQVPHLCRCEECRAAKSAANRRERERRAAKRSAQSVDSAV